MAYVEQVGAVRGVEVGTEFLAHHFVVGYETGRRVAGVAPPRDRGRQDK